MWYRDASAKLIKKPLHEMSIEIKNGKLHTYNIYLTKSFYLFITLFFSLSIALTASVRPDKNWIIVIDAGHGGKDPGAIGSFSKEKDITLAIALKTGEYIEKNIKNVTVIYTRKNDTFVDIRERADIANKNDANLFISIHANWAKSKTIQGTETFIMGLAKDQQNLEVAMKENEVILLEDNYSTKYEGFDPKSAESYVMFTFAQHEYRGQSTELASNIQSQFRDKISRIDRGVKQAGFWVLFMTTMPSVLTETGFITHPEEEKFLNSKQGQDYLASAIFRACREYVNDIDRKSEIATADYDDKYDSTSYKDDTVTTKETLVSKTEKKCGGDNNTSTLKDISTGKDAITGNGTVAKADTAIIINKIKAKVNPPKVEEKEGEPVFMVQIASSMVKIKVTPENFKGFVDVVELQADNRFKYATGSFMDLSSAIKFKNNIAAIFPGAFIIAVKDSKILPLQQVIEQKKIKY